MTKQDTDIVEAAHRMMTAMMAEREATCVMLEAVLGKWAALAHRERAGGWAEADTVFTFADGLESASVDVFKVLTELRASIRK